MILRTYQLFWRINESIKQSVYISVIFLIEKKLLQQSTKLAELDFDHQGLQPLY